MARRTSLASLGEKLAKKPIATPAKSAPEKKPPRAKSQPDGRRGILVRAHPEAWKALKLLSLDRGITLQDVMTEAVNDLLRKYGKPPLA